MNYLQRVKARIIDEGVIKTVQYGLCVGYDSANTFLKDTYLDLKYSGKVLYGNIPTNFKHLGANDIYHTDYSAMPLIFKNIEIKPDDVLVDIGCGKGRVINYWLSQKYKNPIIGLELDPVIAQSTARQFAKKPNVTIIPGDAVRNVPPEGTIFYFYNPFDEQKVLQFEHRLAEITEKPVKIVYYNPQSLQAFANSSWQIKRINFEQDLGINRWGRLNKYHDLAIITKRACYKIPICAMP